MNYCPSGFEQKISSPLLVRLFLDQLLLQSVNQWQRLQIVSWYVQPSSINWQEHKSPFWRQRRRTIVINLSLEVARLPDTPRGVTTCLPIVLHISHTARNDARSCSTTVPSVSNHVECPVVCLTYLTQLGTIHLHVPLYSPICVKSCGVPMVCLTYISHSYM